MLGSLLSLSLLVVGSYGLRAFVDPVVFAGIHSHANIPPQPQYSWTEYWYASMPVDHFAYADTRTFPLRYLMNTDNYKAGGPIFFYTGNEGPIDGFANNTGLVWDLSKQFRAAVVFAEHRFYGKTQPFHDESYTDLKNLGLLSSEQALADYAVLLGHLKTSRDLGTIFNVTGIDTSNAPVIAFGGSYGGMLAAWFRIKYPHVVIGALSSSAPVLQFEGTGVGDGVFESIIKRTFVNSGCNADNFPKAWTALRNLAGTAAGRTFLNNLFKLSPISQMTSVNDTDGLIGFVREGIEYMAMVDYPYPSNFLKPLPGWPVKVACQSLNGVMNDDQALATAMYNVANLYYNYTGSETTFCVPFINPNCSDAATSALGTPLGWPWQACTEMIMPICAKGPPNDLFFSDCGPTGWTTDLAFSQCQQIFSNLGYTRAMFRPDWIITNYGGNFAAASNIIFSNGALDPWSGGGVTPSSPGVSQAQKNGVYAFVIDQSGHHLDLRQPNSCDPPSLIEARFNEVNIMWCWAYPNDAQCQPATTSTSTTTTTASTTSSSTTTTPSTTSTSTTTTTPTTTTSTTTTTTTSTSTTTTTPTTTTPAPCAYVQNGYPWGYPGASPTPPATTATTTPPTTSTTPASTTTSTPTTTSTTSHTTTKGSMTSFGSPLLGLLLSALFVAVIRF